MFDDESWGGSQIILGSRGQEVKVTSHKDIAGVVLCTLVSAGFLYTVSRKSSP